MTASKLTVKPVTRSTWADFEALFEGKGAPHYCWCMAWRPMADRIAAGNAARKRALHERVRKRVPIGLLGYVKGEPVAWCSVAPRTTFLNLSEKQDDTEEGIWSVVCFFIRRDHREHGLSRQMLDEALRYAQKRGAKAVEAYPVDPHSPSYRFMGFVPLFAGRGFKPHGRAGSRRYVMRRRV
ncbi:MAG: GNAT family N-acetyltransferase [Parvibaculaceae bacterium]